MLETLRFPNETELQAVLRVFDELLEDVDIQM